MRIIKKRVIQMPRANQPQSLYQYSKLVVNSLISHKCKLIQEENGAYEEPACQLAINEFQSFLLANIPGHVLDDLCSNITWKGGEISRKSRAPRIFNDPRILLSVYMHSNIHQFSVDIRLPNNDAFWLDKLCDFKKIVRLDLKMVCTDEILQVISENCRQLEEINIISKSESCECSNQTFNALKLKYFISDDGLRHLCQCRNLKKIEMNKTLRPQCAGRMMTHQGIKDVIKLLPKLEYISYYDVGTIVNMLVDQVERLPLVHIYDSHSETSHIIAMAKLCPNLQELFLIPPVASRHTKKASDILQALADSDLKVKVIDLKYFPIDRSIGEFLKHKGKYLTSLSLLNTEPLSSDDLMLIGVCCLNIENLHLNDVTKSISDYENLHISPKKPIFSLLRCLNIHGNEWLPHIILPICLRNAKHLMNLSLTNSRYMGLMDDAISKVLQTNSMTKLIGMFLNYGCYISFDMLVKLVTVCSDLRSLSMFSHAHLNSKDVFNLKKELQNKDLSIDLLTMPLV